MKLLTVLRLSPFSRAFSSVDLTSQITDQIRLLTQDFNVVAKGVLCKKLHLDESLINCEILLLELDADLMRISYIIWKDFIKIIIGSTFSVRKIIDNNIDKIDCVRDLHGHPGITVYKTINGIQETDHFNYSDFPKHIVDNHESNEYAIGQVITKHLNSHSLKKNTPKVLNWHRQEVFLDENQRRIVFNNNNCILTWCGTKGTSWIKWQAYRRIEILLESKLDVKFYIRKYFSDLNEYKMIEIEYPKSYKKYVIKNIKKLEGKELEDFLINEIIYQNNDRVENEYY